MEVLIKDLSRLLLYAVCYMLGLLSNPFANMAVAQFRKLLEFLSNICNIDKYGEYSGKCNVL